MHMKQISFFLIHSLVTFTLLVLIKLINVIFTKMQNGSGFASQKQKTPK